MVSDMKEWCNQYQCPNCKDRGYILIRNDIVPRPCTCAATKKLMEKAQYKPEPWMKWDFIWMNLAKSVGTRSTCRVPNRQVGCVIVSDDNTKVLAIGYNGSAKGDDNSCEYDGNQRKIGDSRCTCVHAEQNALVKLDTSNPCKKRMYLTLSPCSLCYKLIVNAGITEVIYDEEYSFIQLEKLVNLGVKVRQYENN